MIRDIFDGTDTGPRRDFLLLNTGFALYVAGLSDSPEEGITKARKRSTPAPPPDKLADIVVASNALE